MHSGSSTLSVAPVEASESDRDQRRAAGRQTQMGSFHPIIAIKTELSSLIEPKKLEKSSIMRTRVEKLFMLSYDPSAAPCDSLEESDLRNETTACVK